jgi:hypothetical protein
VRIRLCPHSKKLANVIGFGQNTDDALAGSVDQRPVGGGARCIDVLLIPQ